MVDEPPFKGGFTVSIEQKMDTVSVSLDFDESADADATYDHLVSQALHKRIVALNLINSRIKGASDG